MLIFTFRTKLRFLMDFKLNWAVWVLRRPLVKIWFWNIEQQLLRWLGTGEVRRGEARLSSLLTFQTWGSDFQMTLHIQGMLHSHHNKSFSWLKAHLEQRPAYCPHINNTLAQFLLDFSFSKQNKTNLFYYHKNQDIPQGLASATYLCK